MITPPLGGRSTLAGTLAALVLVSLLLTPPAATAQSPPPSIHYVYDDLGRLSAVIDQQGNVAQYFYDPVGNITRIDRVSVDEFPNDPVLITLFTPARGRVGTRVEIFGRGFSATPSENTLTFNGQPATVTEAAVNRLVTSVPAGATTGPIRVTAPRGAATSRTPFTVGGVLAVSPTTVTLGVNGTRRERAGERGSVCGRSGS